MRRTPAALIVVFLAAAANPLHGDLTPAAIMARMTNAYAHAAAYTDSGTVDTGESWPWTLWHLLTHGRAHDAFRTTYVRGRSIRFVYSSADGQTLRAEKADDLAPLAGLTHGTSTAVPLLLTGSADAPIGRLSGLRRTADSNIRGTRCFTVVGSLHARDADGAYTLHIDQRTYMLRRVTRELVARNATSRDTINYLQLR